MKKYINLLLGLCFLGGFSSCSDDEMTDSIFDTTEHPLDPNSYTYPLDCFLKENFLEPYNLRYVYKLEDIMTDMEYNLIPCDYEKAIDMAILSKYLWFDVYGKVVSPEFLKYYAPRIIHLVGSPAINPSTGTYEAGLAEGGLKITLYNVNALDVTNTEKLNSNYFQTMHHEFTHILHQTKTYPVEFNEISVAQYDPSKWQEKNDSIVLSLGFVTPYAGKENREDFAELISTYIVSTPQQWANKLNTAKYEWEIVTKKNYADIDTDLELVIDIIKDSNTGNPIEYKLLRKKIVRDGDDNPVVATDEEGNEIYDENGKPVYTYIDAAGGDAVKGDEVLTKKLNLCRTWLKDAWNIELDSLRAEVQRRQASLNIDELREEVYKYKKEVEK